MVDTIVDPLAESQFTQQREKIEAIKEKLKAVDEEFEPQITALEKSRRISQLPIYNEAREIYKTIPKFWFRVFSNHGVLCPTLSPDDAKALEHLIDIKVDFDSNDSEIYTLTFVFEDNEYFTNKEVIYEAVKGESLNVKPFTFDWKDDSKNLVKIGEESDEGPSFFSCFIDDDSLEFGENFLMDLFTDAPSFYNQRGGSYEGHEHAGGCCGGDDHSSEEEEDEEDNEE